MPSAVTNKRRRCTGGRGSGVIRGNMTIIRAMQQTNQTRGVQQKMTMGGVTMRGGGEAQGKKA